MSKKPEPARGEEPEELVEGFDNRRDLDDPHKWREGIEERLAEVERRLDELGNS